MKYKCVNELDKFIFRDAQVKKCEYSPEQLTVEAVGVVAKYDNSCNETLTERYIDAACMRLKNPVITKFFLEGAKYYDANGVLQEEVPDHNIPAGDYGETFRVLGGGRIFVLTPKEAAQEGKLCCELAVDVGEEDTDTYWVEVEFDKAIVEWNNFLNKTVQEG